MCHAINDREITSQKMGEECEPLSKARGLAGQGWGKAVGGGGGGERLGLGAWPPGWPWYFPEGREGPACLASLWLCRGCTLNRKRQSGCSGRGSWVSGGMRARPVFSGGPAASWRAFGVRSSVSSSKWVRRRTASHRVDLGSPGAEAGTRHRPKKAQEPGGAGYNHNSGAGEPSGLPGSQVDHVGVSNLKASTSIPIRRSGDRAG